MVMAPVMTQAPPRADQVPRPAEQPLRMSYEEFLKWADEDVHAEWVNGEVIVQMPPQYGHQLVITFLITLLELFNRLFKLGELLAAPFEMRATPGGPAREPDLLFVASENLSRLTDNRLAGPADLIVEIVSDDSVHRDRVDKFYEYEDAGVREYWIVDPRPRRQRVEFYVRDERGRFQPVLPDPAGVYHSTVLPNFWLRVEWLLAETPPDPLVALAQIVGAEKIMSVIGQSVNR